MIVVSEYFIFLTLFTYILVSFIPIWGRWWHRWELHCQWYTFQDHLSCSLDVDSLTLIWRSSMWSPLSRHSNKDDLWSSPTFSWYLSTMSWTMKCVCCVLAMSCKLFRCVISLLWQLRWIFPLFLFIYWGSWTLWEIRKPLDWSTFFTTFAYGYIWEQSQVHKIYYRYYEGIEGRNGVISIQWYIDMIPLFCIPK